MLIQGQLTVSDCLSNERLIFLWTVQLYKWVIVVSPCYLESHGDMRDCKASAGNGESRDKRCVDWELAVPQAVQLAWVPQYVLNSSPHFHMLKAVRVITVFSQGSSRQVAHDGEIKPLDCTTGTPCVFCCLPGMPWGQRGGERLEDSWLQLIVQCLAWWVAVFHASSCLWTWVSPGFRQC